MASTFQARVQTYLGSGYSETTLLSDHLTAGAKQITDLIPEIKIDEYCANLTDSGSGVTVSGSRLVRAHKGGYKARRIDAGLKTQATPSGALSTVAIVAGGTGYSVNDVLTLSQGTTGTCTVTAVSTGVVTAVEITTAGSSFTLGVKTTTVAPSGGTNCTLYVIPTNSSIYEATTTDPVWYVENTKGYVLPGGGTIVGMAYPTVAYGDSTISNFPTELDQAVVLYAVIQGCLDLINDTRVSLDALSYTAPTTTIDGTIWATAYPNYATAIGTALTAVTTQLGNGVTAQANTTTLLGTTIPTAIGLANAEVDKAVLEVAKMSAEIDLAKTEVGESATNIDIPVDTATAAITTANGRINTAVALANVEFDKVSAIVDLANVEFDKIAAKLATASTTITTSEDLEKGQAELQQGISISTNGDTYLKEANERLANGNAYLEEAKTSLQEAQGYVSEVSARIAQVQAQIGVAGGYFGTAQGYGNTAQSYLGTAQGFFQESQKDLELASQYSQSTNTYINLAQGYSNEVGARLSNVSAKVAEYNSKVQETMAKYQADQQKYQSEINHFQLILNGAKKEFEDYLKGRV